MDSSKCMRVGNNFLFLSEGVLPNTLTDVFFYVFPDCPSFPIK